MREVHASTIDAARTETLRVLAAEGFTPRTVSFCADGSIAAYVTRRAAKAGV